ALPDDEQRHALTDAEAKWWKEQPILNNRFLRQVTRSDTPVAKSEVVPALLTEEPEVIRTVMEAFDGQEIAAEVRQGMAGLIAEVRARGEMSPSEAEEK